MLPRRQLAGSRPHLHIVPLDLPVHAQLLFSAMLTCSLCRHARCGIPGPHLCAAVPGPVHPAGCDGDAAQCSHARRAHTLSVASLPPPFVQLSLDLPMSLRRSCAVLTCSLCSHARCDTPAPQLCAAVPGPASVCVCAQLLSSAVLTWLSVASLTPTSVQLSLTAAGWCPLGLTPSWPPQSTPRHIFPPVFLAAVPGPLHPPRGGGDAAQHGGRPREGQLKRVHRQQRRCAGYETCLAVNRVNFGVRSLLRAAT